MKSRFENSMKNVLEQIKKAEQVIKEFKGKVAHIDKQAARAMFDEIKETGLKEASRVKDRLQDQLVGLSQDLLKTSGKLKTESEKVRGTVDQTLKIVKTQIKNLAEKERTKRKTGKRRAKKTTTAE